MEQSPIIRFRIDREIAAKAYRMAAQRGMDLPDVMRMMLTKAVSIGDFSIDRACDGGAAGADDQPLERYEPRYWEPLKEALDAEAALALLNQAIADRSAWLDRNLKLKASDVAQFERVQDERDKACRLLAAFDPTDRQAVGMVFATFGAAAAAASSSPPLPSSGKSQ